MTVCERCKKELPSNAFEQSSTLSLSNNKVISDGLCEWCRKCCQDFIETEEFKRLDEKYAAKEGESESTGVVPYDEWPESFKNEIKLGDI